MKTKYLNKVKKLLATLEKVQEQLRDIADENFFDTDHPLKESAFNLDESIFGLESFIGEEELIKKEGL